MLKASRLTRAITGTPNAHRLSYQPLDDPDPLESLSIKATRLNAFTLDVLSAVEVSWTHNISRHMLLSRHGGRNTLEIFALPCALGATTSKAIGIPLEYAQEIRESYGILFNAWPAEPMHAKLGFFLGIRKLCQCWSCCAHRYRRRIISSCKESSDLKSSRTKDTIDTVRSEFDPMLVNLMNNDTPPDWTYDFFPCLWPRIILLEQHLRTSRPWSIWVLFCDRRDTMQFWTFL